MCEGILELRIMNRILNRNVLRTPTHSLSRPTSHPLPLTQLPHPLTNILREDEPRSIAHPSGGILGKNFEATICPPNDDFIHAIFCQIESLFNIESKSKTILKYKCTRKLEERAMVWFLNK